MNTKTKLAWTKDENGNMQAYVSDLWLRTFYCDDPINQGYGCMVGSRGIAEPMNTLEQAMESGERLAATLFWEGLVLLNTYDPQLTSIMYEFDNQKNAGQFVFDTEDMSFCYTSICTNTCQVLVEPDEQHAPEGVVDVFSAKEILVLDALAALHGGALV